MHKLKICHQPTQCHQRIRKDQVMIDALGRHIL